MIIKAQINYVLRLANDVNGNPRYSVWTTEGDQFTTQSGSQCSYGFDKWAGKSVVLQTTRSGLIWDVKLDRCDGDYHIIDCDCGMPEGD